MEKKLQKTVSYILQFIDSTRFMASSLSILVNDLSEGIHRIKYKFYCCKRMLILIKIWLIGKNSMKGHYLKKDDFYSYFNMENITDGDYAHAKKVCKDFEIKNIGEYHDLYVQTDTLLLADVFENFKNMYLDIYEQQDQRAKFFSTPGLARQAALIKT